MNKCTIKFDGKEIMRMDNFFNECDIEIKKC